MNQNDNNQKRTESILIDSYFCGKCQRFHFYGRDWENHKEYAAESKPFDNSKTIGFMTAPRRETE